LTVGKPPTWAKKMEFHEEIWETAGKTVELKCPAEGHPAPKIQWLKDDEPLLDRPIGTVSIVTQFIKLLRLVYGILYFVM